MNSSLWAGVFCLVLVVPSLLAARERSAKRAEAEATDARFRLAREREHFCETGALADVCDAQQKIATSVYDVDDVGRFAEKCRCECVTLDEFEAMGGDGGILDQVRNEWQRRLMAKNIPIPESQMIEISRVLDSDQSTEIARGEYVRHRPERSKWPAALMTRMGDSSMNGVWYVNRGDR